MGDCEALVVVVFTENVDGVGVWEYIAGSVVRKCIVGLVVKVRAEDTSTEQTKVL